MTFSALYLVLIGDAAYRQAVLACPLGQMVRCAGRPDYVKETP